MCKKGVNISLINRAMCVIKKKGEPAKTHHPFLCTYPDHLERGNGRDLSPDEE